MNKNFLLKLQKKYLKKSNQNVKDKSQVFFFKNPMTSKNLTGSFIKAVNLAYGLGESHAFKFANLFGFKPGSLISYSSKNYIQRIFSRVEKNVNQTGLIVESSLKKKLESILLFKKKNGFNSGLRYSQGLPSRGQRSKTNARTSKNRRSSSASVNK